MENSKFNDLQNICRTCMFTCDLKPITHDSFIIDILQKIADINFNESDGLPKNICSFCINKINDIHFFALQCKNNETNLKEYLMNYNNETIINTHEEQIQIKEEFINNSIIIEEIKEELEPTKEIIIDEMFVKTETEFKENSDKENADCDTFRLTIHNNDPAVPKKPKCEICSKVFKASRNLKAHRSIHTGERPFLCTLCPKTFRTPSDLKIHTRSHTGEKPYLCDQCPKAYSTSSHLNVHKRLHTGERPFKCLKCGKQFRYDQGLANHLKIHEGIRPFKCTHCPKRFVTSSHLTVHERTHTYERPYKCRSCDKAFVDAGSLSRHNRTHAGERSYECTKYPKTFTHLQALKKPCDRTLTKPQILDRHRIRHDSLDRKCLHNCETCNKVFKNAQGLAKHLRAHSVSIDDENFI